MSNEPTSRRRQGVFWILTIPRTDWSAPDSLPGALSWIRGQAERGDTTGYEHWQIAIACKSKCALRQIKDLFGSTCHAELTRSKAAGEYVWKEETRIEGTQFELGTKPILRSSKIEWESVWVSAKSGDLDSIPANIRVVNYRTLQTIASDHAQCPAIERQCYVFCGTTGIGKSRRAWEEAGVQAYAKDPRTKFWCGYTNQQHVIIDEFRGGIDISHLLRWIDRYPVRVEIKGSSRPLLCVKFWITSNLHPRNWYPLLDPETIEALLRRLEITEFE